MGMRIMFFQPGSAKKAVSGPERQTVQLAKAFVARGHDVVFAIILVHKNENVEKTSIGIHAREQGLSLIPVYIPQKYNLVHSVKALDLVVRFWQPDVICTSEYKADVIAALYNKVPSIAVVRGWTGQNWKIKLFEWLAKRTFNRHSAIVVVAPAQRPEVLRYGVPAERVFYIPNALDVTSIPPPHERQTLMREIGKGEPAPLVGVVGRLSKEKGVDVAIEAFEGFLRQGGKAYLVIVGDGEERRLLQRKVEASQISQRVAFLGERADGRQIIGALDVLLVSSLTEGLPNVILEAFAYKTPVVATAVGGVPELVRDGETGWLVPPKDPQAITRAVMEVLQNPVESRRRAENAHVFLLREFSLNKQVDKWEHVLEFVSIGRR